MAVVAISNCRVFDGDRFQTGKAVLIEDGKISGLVTPNDIPADAKMIDAKGQTLAPGFIDVQVNGGGGVMLNDSTDIDGLRIMMEGHRKYGTTSMMPTLITADRETMEAAIVAVREAVNANLPGIVGIHLEGPYLNPARKGVHDENIIRPMEEDAIDLLCSLGTGRTIVTLAPEKAEPGTIAKLTERGILVCAGHTAGTFDDMQPALGEGMRGFTHLFNAMSPMTHRAPGVAGAAMADDQSWCGLIADGYHVHPAVMKIAVRAKATGKIMLVTDAMATVGAKDKRFVWKGEEIIATDGRCALADGTLAGSDLDMISAVRNCVEMIGLDLTEALRMASLYPATFLKLDDSKGRIAPGYDADLVLFDDNFQVTQTWINGA